MQPILYYLGFGVSTRNILW